ncbi:uncharacterized protein Z519_05268 [Cladophialophora bantiana CBS 173.52]|uniref:Kelch repeat protein n=1 Tax=Cladophialophora bantiana (strain ATCC 10958 / CBS 173.52 / CDC B-1940 / NIH 8579) TaxID=1442370 RepID=A0A0D2HL18_CLAB1|nr:uncharacterized protein Z519_05268 [Cladophialophora bantiana CBS 173.52]KIW93953.1 hypothetical protein Z519_05268 [Cladophialophora bantiana CBS 173.52]
MSAADGSSHNIYVYGGLQAASSDALGDVWILPLPAFHWIPVTTGSAPRSVPACAVVADRYDWPCVQAQSGLGLFDLTHLDWTSTYEAPPEQSSSVTSKSSTTSNLYAIPSQVYNIICGNVGGGATVTAPSAGFATNTALASIFADAVKVSGSSSSTASAATPSIDSSHTASATTSATSNGSTATGSHSSHSHAGAIAGGVVGGVGGLVVIVASLIWVNRTRPYEVDGNERHEAGGSDRHEADGSERHEADGQRTAQPAGLLPQELQAPLQ